MAWRQPVIELLTHSKSVKQFTRYSSHYSSFVIDFYDMHSFSFNTPQFVEDEAVVAELLRQNKGSLELVDARQYLPLFRARPGLSSWVVMDDYHLIREVYFRIFCIDTYELEYFSVQSIKVSFTWSLLIELAYVGSESSSTKQFVFVEETKSRTKSGKCIACWGQSRFITGSWVNWSSWCRGGDSRERRGRGRSKWSISTGSGQWGWSVISTLHISSDITFPLE